MRNHLDPITDERLRALACGAGGPIRKGEMAQIARELADLRGRQKQNDEIAAVAKTVLVEVPPGSLDGLIAGQNGRLRELLRESLAVIDSDHAACWAFCSGTDGKTTCVDGCDLGKLAERLRKVLEREGL